MKNKLKYMFIGTALLGVSCSSDYLETEPTQFLSTEQVGEAAENNEYVATALMNGVYSLMFQTGTGGTTGHDDFGQKGYDIYTDFLSSDMALSLSTYGWYRQITEYQVTQDFTFTDNYQPWRYYYRIIRSCNLVIDANGGNDAVPEGESSRWIMGQAKAMRAHSYFYLTQLYANDYDPAQEILPIYRTPQDQNGPKVPASEIYELIVSDLTQAIELLGDFNRGTKTQVNKHVAQGILAYVYGVMGNNAEVKALTDEIIAEGGFTLMGYDEVTNTGFNTVDIPGWMWGMDLTLDNGLDLVSWWGQMDLFTYSYAWAGDRKTIDFDLYSSIPEDDARKLQFYNDPSSPYYLMPINKFYDSNRVIGGQRNITTDYVYMRVAEMYLLNAEAAAKIGDEASAKTRLQEFLVNRIPDASYVDGLSGQALLDEIYLQTRIELWGEGKSYLNLKRNHGSTFRGPNHLSYVGETVQYDDERLTFEIPQSEIQNNPHISTQN